MKKYLIFLSLFSILSILSCKKGSEEVEPVPTEKNRTVLCYIGAANNLNIEAYDKIDQLKNGWNPEIDGNLLIYHDANVSDCPRLLLVTGEGKSRHELIEQYEKHNSADPEVFHNVLETMVKEFPAKSYGLIVFSHATGWLPPQDVVKTKAVIEHNGDEMDIKDFSAAIPGKLFDFVVFEACNMASVEVLYELKDKTDFILASAAEIWSPGFSNIYADHVKSFFAPTADLKGFARDYYNWEIEKGSKSATIALFETAFLENLKDLVKAILKEQNTGVSMEILQNFDGIPEGPYYFNDLAQYYGSMASSQQKEQLDNLLKNLVPYKVSTESHKTSSGIFPISVFSGLTTYILQEDLVDLNKEYYKLQWYKAINP